MQLIARGHSLSSTFMTSWPQVPDLARESLRKVADVDLLEVVHAIARWQNLYPTFMISYVDLDRKTRAASNRRCETVHQEESLATRTLSWYLTRVICLYKTEPSRHVSRPERCRLSSSTLHDHAPGNEQTPKTWRGYTSGTRVYFHRIVLGGSGVHNF
jgi:hypothetical protein